jgi:hypothetical protein
VLHELTKGQSAELLLQSRGILPLPAAPALPDSAGADATDTIQPWALYVPPAPEAVLEAYEEEWQEGGADKEDDDKIVADDYDEDYEDEEEEWQEVEDDDDDDDDSDQEIDAAMRQATDDLQEAAFTQPVPGGQAVDAGGLQSGARSTEGLNKQQQQRNVEEHAAVVQYREGLQHSPDRPATAAEAAAATLALAARMENWQQTLAQQQQLPASGSADVQQAVLAVQRAFQHSAVAASVASAVLLNFLNSLQVATAAAALAPPRSVPTEQLMAAAADCVAALALGVGLAYGCREHVAFLAALLGRLPADIIARPVNWMSICSCTPCQHPAAVKQVRHDLLVECKPPPPHAHICMHWHSSPEMLSWQQTMSATCIMYGSALQHCDVGGILLVMSVVQCLRTYSTLLLPCGHFSWWTAQKPSVHHSVLHESTEIMMSEPLIMTDTPCCHPTQGHDGHIPLPPPALGGRGMLCCMH